MAIPVPSIWDYLAQAGSVGIGSYQDARERALQEEARKRAEAMQGLQMVLALNQAGAAPFTQVNQALQRASSMEPTLQGVQLEGPTVPELKATTTRRITTEPGQTAPAYIPGIGALPSVPRFTEEQYELAGMTSPTARRQQRRLGEAQVRGAEAGATVSEAEARPEQIAVKQYTDMLKAMDNVASSGADAAIASAGGPFRLTAKNVPQMTDSAYAAMEKSGALRAFGLMDETKTKALKNMISTRVMDRMLQAYEADTQRMNARNRLASGLGTEWDKAYDNISAAVTQLQRDIAAFENGDMAMWVLNPIMNPDKLKLPAEAVTAITQARNEYGMKRERLSKLQEAQYKMLSGSMTRGDYESFMKDAQPAQLTGTPQAGATPTQQLPTAVPDEMIDRIAKQLETLPRNQRKEILRTSASFSEDTKRRVAKKLGLGDM